MRLRGVPGAADDLGVGADGGHSDGEDLLEQFDGPDGEVAAAAALVVPDAVTQLEQVHFEKMQQLREQRELSMSWGAPGVLVALDNAIHAEEKRFKAVRQANPAVVTAMLQRQAEERALMAKKRDEIAALNAKKRTIRDLERDHEAKKEELALIRQECKQAKRDMDEVLAIRTFSLRELGKDKANKADVKKAKKVRHEVLDKMSWLGDGLSAEQRRDFEFFKTHWDDVNEQDKGTEWPELFARLMQKVQDDHCKGESNAFSTFVFNESERCLTEIPRIRI